LLIIEVRVKYIKFVTLNGLRWGVIFSKMHAVIFIPLACDPYPVDADWLHFSKSALGLAWHPIIELFFILFHSLILLKFYDLFCYLIVGVRLLCYNLGGK